MTSLNQKEVYQEKRSEIRTFVPQPARTVGFMGVVLIIFFWHCLSGTNAIVFPAMVAEFGGGDIYPVAISGWSAFSIVSTALAGRFGKIFDKRTILLIGSALFATPLWLQNFAPNMPVVIVLRCISGMGAGLVSALVMAVIADLYDNRRRPFFVSFFTFAIGFALVIFPLFTGYIIDRGNWRGLFWFIFIGMLVGSLLVLIFLPRFKPEIARREGEKVMDWGGLILIFLALGLIAVIFGFAGKQFGESIPLPWLSPQTIILIIVCISSFILFPIAESKVGDRAIIPMRMFKNKNFALCFICNFLFMVGNVGMLFFLGTYMVLAMNTTSTEAGMAATANALPYFLTPLAGAYLAKTGNYRQWLLLSIGLLGIVPLAIFTFLSPTTPAWVCWVLMFLYGIACAADGFSFISTAQETVPPADRTIATSALRAIMITGSLTASAVCGFFITSFGIEVGFKIWIWVALVLTIVTTLFITKIKNPRELNLKTDLT